MQIFYSYFIVSYFMVILDPLRSFFFDGLFLLLAIILSELYDKPRRNKDSVTEKKCIEEFVWGTSMFWLHAFLSLQFVTFFVYSLPLPKWRTCWMAPIKTHNTLAGGVLCNELWVNGQKYEDLLQFNNSWLISLRTWYYCKSS